MNSKQSIYKLGRTKSHREAMQKNLLTSLVLYEHVKTTKAKAKSILPLFDKLISEAKKPDQQAQGSLEQMLFDQNAIRKVVEVYKERFADENQGLVRMFRLKRRKGDNAEIVQLFVKGYVYKEIGKQSRKAAKKKDDRKDSKVAEVAEAAKVNTQKSQVKGGAMLGKAKSRSGI